MIYPITMPVWTCWSWTWEKNWTKKKSWVAKGLRAIRAQSVDGLLGNTEMAWRQAFWRFNSYIASVPQMKTNGKGKEGRSRRSWFLTFAFCLFCDQGREGSKQVVGNLSAWKGG